MNWSGYLSVKTRVIVFLILLAGFFLWPWWVTVILAVAAAIIINNIYEVAIIGLLLDTVFGFSGAGPFNLSLPFTVLLLLIVLVSEPIKNRFIFSR